MIHVISAMTAVIARRIPARLLSAMGAIRFWRVQHTGLIGTLYSAINAPQSFGTTTKG